MLLRPAFIGLPTTTSTLSITVGSWTARKKVTKLKMATTLANFSPKMSSKANHEGVEGQSRIDCTSFLKVGERKLDFPVKSVKSNALLKS